MRPAPALALLVAFACFLFGTAAANTEPIEFNLPAQSADRALLAFARQAKVEILFSSSELRQKQSTAVIGRYDPEQALVLLLRETGFTPRRTGEGKWIVTPTGPPSGNIKGKILAPDGSPARRVAVIIPAAGRKTETSETGEFTFAGLQPGDVAIVVVAESYRTLQINAHLPPNMEVMLRPQTLQRLEDPTRLEPFVVEGRSAHATTLDHSEAHLGLRGAGGNLDLARTESDALPYMIFNRGQIARSGVVNLNEFLQRELIDGNAGAMAPEQNGSTDTFAVGSNNLSLRGYSSEETVILVNGRRLPEVLTSGGADTPSPDVNFIPLSMVQQVEVLPVSASSLYSGNAVGGVINIVLRPGVDANASEVTATYTNALSHYDAPQSSLSLLHAQTLLEGTLRLRLNASFGRSIPATEAELGYRQRRSRATPGVEDAVYRATPNVRSIRPEILARAPGFEGDDAGPASALNSQPAPIPLPPLFGPGTPSVTSVAPGADGSGGLAAFAGREGRRNFAFFDSAGSFSTSSDSLDFPYGREQERSTYYGSAVFDAASWLQLGVDATYSSTVMHRGFDVVQGDLTLKASSPFNPFGRDVLVYVNETPQALGEHYGEARLEFGSVVLGAILKLPRDWQLALDAQYAHNVVRYGGLVGANKDRWQRLVDDGVYNPLRDTQRYGPPAAFYDQVLLYRRGRGRFVTLGDYDTLDLAFRATNEVLPLPTGKGVLNVGADYRRNHLAKYSDERRYGDGTLDGGPTNWAARTLGRYSFFGELQSPVLPEKRLPRWVKEATLDLALRYVASNDTHEANFAPTYAGKIVFPVGLTLRGSITTSTRFPTPRMSRLQVTPSDGGGTAGVNKETVTDYLRNETYNAEVTEIITPDLRPESALTQTAGLVFQRGQTHRFRAAIDFVDTHKIDELVPLSKELVTAKEALWPERVQRAAPARGETVGRILTVFTGRANLAKRFSQDWTASLDYRWNGCLGGTFEAYARTLYFQRYVVRTLPNAPASDELSSPEGVVPILRYRSNFGASWANKDYGLGIDGHYFHSRVLPRREWEAQGRGFVRPFWQFDTFCQADVARWLPWKSTRYGLRAQARVNNVFGTPYPKYVNDAYNSGIQPYGDWRGRVYSLSLTATF